MKCKVMGREVRVDDGTFYIVSKRGDGSEKKWSINVCSDSGCANNCAGNGGVYPFIRLSESYPGGYGTVARVFAVEECIARQYEPDKVRRRTQGRGKGGPGRGFDMHGQKRF